MTVELRTEHSRSRASTSQGLAAGLVFDEPQDDWVPLRIAPFYFTQNRGMLCASQWELGIRTEVEGIIAQLNCLELNASDFRVSSSSDRPLVSIHAWGITTTIGPGWIKVGLDDDWPFQIRGSSREILSDVRWQHFPENIQAGVDEHRRVLCQLFYLQRSSLAKAIMSNDVWIMARKNSVFAPFERIHGDQWQFFSSDSEDDNHPAMNWFDPQEPELTTPMATATGPTGERLYAIYVAPRAKSEVQTPEEKCLQWLLGLLHKFQDRSPKPLGALEKEAKSKFPGLSGRGFRRCLCNAQKQSGNRGWSLSGRPKSHQKS
jgi:hypothetical protein